MIALKLIIPNYIRRYLLAITPQLPDQPAESGPSLRFSSHFPAPA